MIVFTPRIIVGVASNGFVVAVQREANVEGRSFLCLSPDAALAAIAGELLALRDEKEKREKRPIGTIYDAQIDGMAAALGTTPDRVREVIRANLGIDGFDEKGEGHIL